MDTPDIVEVLTPVVETFDELGIPYHIGGSVAGTAFGLSRATVDVDVVADIRSDQVRLLVQRLQNDYYIDEQMIADAIRHRASFNIIHFATTFKVDVFIPKGRPFDREVAQRARMETLADQPGARAFAVASPEDLILAKLEWYRMGGEISDRQWNDILGIMKVQGQALDISYLKQWAPSLNVADLLDRALDDSGLTGS